MTMIIQNWKNKKVIWWQDFYILLEVIKCWFWEDYEKLSMYTINLRITPKKNYPKYIIESTTDKLKWSTKKSSHNPKTRQEMGKWGMENKEQTRNKI